MEVIWYWLAYSFLGYCLEKIFAAVTRSSHLPHLWERMALGAFAATVVEYAVHWGYETLFGVQFWDYSSSKCDVNGRVCLPFSLCWGVLSALAVRYVQPVLENYAARLPAGAAALAMFLVVLDGILTARVLLVTRDIDALTPRTLIRLRRRTA